jgi:hypothetical protein
MECTTRIESMPHPKLRFATRREREGERAAPEVVSRKQIEFVGKTHDIDSA